jgi:sugar lactone lactonase YvrE
VIPTFSAAITPAPSTPATSVALVATAIGVSPAGDLYVATGLPSSCRVSKLSDGILVPVVGTGACGYGGDGGPDTGAELYEVGDIAFDDAGHIFLSDWANCRVREVADGVISTVAGNGTCGFSGDGGPATNAELDHPAGLAIDQSGTLYIADEFNCRVRVVRDSVITTLAGNGTCFFSGDGGPPAQAGIEPVGIALAPDGTLYVGDSPTGQEQHASNPDNCKIRAVRPSVITTVAGDGCNTTFSGDGVPATSSSLWLTGAVAVDTAGDLYVEDGFCRVRVVRGGAISTVAGRGWVPATQHDIAAACRYGGEGGLATSATFQPDGIALDRSGDLYIDDGYACRVLRVHDGTISTVVGTGRCPG